MPARLAYPWFYGLIASRLDEDGRLELDAALGDRQAAAERATKRREVAVGLGVEIG